jgi:hypothetical protein
MLLDRYVLGEKPLAGFTNSQMLIRLVIKVKRNAAYQRKGMEIAGF